MKGGLTRNQVMVGGADRSGVPAGCSDAIVAAPARDGLLRYEPREVVATPNGPRERKVAFPAGSPAKVPSGLQMIELRARRKEAGALFTADQHAAAQAYEQVAELVARGGLRCSSLEASGGGGRAGGVDMADQVMITMQRWRRMNAAIPNGAALAPRGLRAHAGRRTITVRHLLRAALLDRAALVDVLERHGWPRQSRHVVALQAALAGALDAIYRADAQM